MIATIAARIDLHGVVRACVAGAFVAALAIAHAARAHAAELVVAHVAPSGSAVASEYGAGAMLYFDRVNRHGGVNGATLRLVTRDDVGDPEATRNEATALLAYKPIAFIGTVGVENVNRLVPVLEKRNVPLVGPMVDLAGVDATNGRGVFHIRANTEQEAQALAARLRALGFSRIALCDQRPQPDTPGMKHPPTLAPLAAPQGAGQSLGAALRTDMPQRTWIAAPRCDRDAATIDAAVNAITQSRAQAVVLIGQTDDAAKFIQSLRAKGSFAMVVASSSVDAERLVAMLPATARMWVAVAEGFPNPAVRAPGNADPIVDEFLDLRAASNSRVSLSRAALAGFAAAKMVVDAVARAGASPMSADVQKALDGADRFAAREATFNFPSAGAVELRSAL